MHVFLRCEGARPRHPHAASVAGRATEDEDGISRTHNLQQVFRSTFAPCWGSGLLLFFTFLMPLMLVPSCGNSPHRSFYPIDFYRGADSAAKSVLANAYTWPYWFGLTVAGGTLYVSIRSKPSAFRVLWLAYATLSSCTALTLWLAFGWELSSYETLREVPWRDWIWMIAPTIVVPLLLVLTFFNCRTWLSAAMWMQLSLSVISLCWFAWLAAAVGRLLLIGGWLALLASATLFVGTIWERASALRALGIESPSRHRAAVRPAGENTMPTPTITAAPVGTVRGA